MQQSHLAALDAADGATDGVISLSNLTIDRAEESATCFTRGTLIHCEDRYRPIEDLVPGDVVTTKDNGPQRLLWIGRRRIGNDELRKAPNLYPVHIAQGALGGGLPTRDLLVSRQHRMLINSALVEKFTGEEQVLVPAIRLTALPGIEVQTSVPEVEYFHLLFSDHEIVWAEDTPSESLYLGKAGLGMLSPAGRAEIGQILPDVFSSNFVPPQACLFIQGKPARQLVSRHKHRGIAPLAC